MGWAVYGTGQAGPYTSPRTLLDRATHATELSSGAYRLLPFGLRLEPTRTDGGKIRTYMEDGR
eukprot:scaffold3920_cov134-Isochrysis_galbana.AAC.6